MQITELVLKSGPNGGGQLHVPLGPSITVFVGANNSGKSLLLREIMAYCRGGQFNRSLLERLDFAAVDEATALAELDRLSEPQDAEAEPSRPDTRHILTSDGRQEVYVPQYVQGRTNPSQYRESYGAYYGQFRVRFLDGPSRLTLISQQQLGSLARPAGLLPRLLTDDPRRTLIRQRIYNQLGRYLALDITNTPMVQVKLGDTPPPIERSFEEATVEYMRKAPNVDQFSDGVKAFCGLMAHIHVGLSAVIIVDEPEAFLAPPLAHALGKELALGALDEGKQVFAATHSAHFLMGAISTGTPVNIVRLTYDGPGTASARLLPAVDLSKLMYDPLLRSANVLSALFYRGVVVGEGDADRAFYQECNERMLSRNDTRAATDTLFLNANGKDVLPSIVGPLRGLGIPVAAIADLDLLNQGGDNWTRHLKACGIPTPDHMPFGARRAAAIRALEAADENYKKGGLDVLSGDAKAAAEDLADDLQKYGLFLVRRGEVEAWLGTLDVPRAKQSWLRSIFEKMGSDPSSVSYVQPADGDVWDFLGSVSAWLKNPNRRGIG